MCLRLGRWGGVGAGEGFAGVKLRVPVAHPSPLIAQDVFGFAQIRPEHTPSRIQLNCLRARTHWLLFFWGPGLLGLGPGGGVDGEFHPNLAKPQLPHPRATENPTVQLSGWGEGCRGPRATNVSASKRTKGGRRDADAAVPMNPNQFTSPNLDARNKLGVISVGSSAFFCLFTLGLDRCHKFNR